MLKEKQALSPELCGLFVFKFMFIRRSSKYVENIILFEICKFIFGLLTLPHQSLPRSLSISRTPETASRAQK